MFILYYQKIFFKAIKWILECRYTYMDLMSAICGHLTYYTMPNAKLDIFRIALLQSDTQETCIHVSRQQLVDSVPFRFSTMHEHCGCL